MCGWACYLLANPSAVLPFCWVQTRAISSLDRATIGEMSGSREERDGSDEKGPLWKLPVLKSKQLGKLGPGFGFGAGCGFGFGLGLLGGN